MPGVDYGRSHRSRSRFVEESSLVGGIEELGLLVRIEGREVGRRVET